MKELLTIKIIQGFKLLQLRQGYKQANILRKFKTLDIEMNAASFSNCLRKKEVGIESLKKIEEGISAIIDSEIGMVFDEDQNIYQQKLLRPDWTPTIILEYEEQTIQSPKFEYFEDGRLSLSQKVEFMQQARQEIVEFGVRLNTFSNYFETRRDSEFKDHITSFLKKGINIKLFLLDPDSNYASAYFNDRKTIQPDEKQSIEVIRSTIERLNRIIVEYESMELKGQLELWLYKHIPYNHFLIVDGGTRSGQMLVSHYLYGIKRANCPVIKISKSSNVDLYKKYWQSYKHLKSDAKKKA